MQEASQSKKVLLDQIKTTKSKIKEYLEHSSQTFEAKEKDRPSSLKSNTSVLEVSMSRYKLPLVEKKSTLSLDYRSRGYSSSLSNNQKRVDYVRLASLKSESNLDASEPSQIYQEDDGGFALTGIREP